jgi:hypothetical protein
MRGSAHLAYECFHDLGLPDRTIEMATGDRRNESEQRRG